MFLGETRSEKKEKAGPNYVAYTLDCASGPVKAGVA